VVPAPRCYQLGRGWGVARVPNPQHTTFNVVPAPNPAGPGNLRRMTHGAQSERVLAPRARELVEEVFAANDHLDRARDTPTVCRYAMTLARVERVYAWLNSKSDSVFADAERGETWPVYERLRQWERQADACEAHLAIAPLTRARLGLMTAQAFDLAKHWEEGGADA
jgi:hypothetical protein